jgi:serine/threonine-protein kinase
MADVFAAIDLKTGREVALKIIRVKSSAYGLGAVWREAALARRVRHHNVCRTLDAGAELVFDDGAPGRSFPFLVLELLEGETLRDRVQRDGPLPLESTIRLALQIAAGLSAIHQAHIIHRDIKSSNVLLIAGAAGDRAVIIDFGLALWRDGGGSRAVPTAPDALTQAVPLCGTPAYMAPEQAMGLSANRSSDVYALGTVLYEMVTGRLPYPAESGRSILYRKQKGARFPRPSALRRDLPVALDRIVCRCLAVRPSDRYHDATQVHRDLADGWRERSADRWDLETAR